MLLTDELCGKRYCETKAVSLFYRHVLFFSIMGFLTRLRIFKYYRKTQIKEIPNAISMAAMYKLVIISGHFWARYMHCRLKIACATEQLCTHIDEIYLTMNYVVDFKVNMKVTYAEMGGIQ